MKTIYYWILFMLLQTQVALAKTEVYKIDSLHSFAKWKVRHIVAKTAGTFSNITGTITLDRDHLEASKVDATINVFSLNSNYKARDIQLLSADYFNATQFKTIHFVSHSLKKINEDSAVLSGKLTLHGVSHEMALPFKLLGFGEDPWGNQRAGFEINTSLKRSDYGITKGLEGIIGDVVEINLLIEGVKIVE